MAEYYAVLSKAIAGLSTTSPETRRAVYDKARNALISQLKAIDPPLPTAEISRQRLELEEAIRRVEREIQSGILPTVAASRSQAPPPPAQPVRAAPTPERDQDSPGDPPRRTPQDLFRQAIVDAEARGNPADTAPPVRPAGPVVRPARERPRSDEAVVLPDLGGDNLSPPLSPEQPSPPMSRASNPLGGAGRAAVEPRLAPDYDLDGTGEPARLPASRMVRTLPPPPERVREVRLGPAPIDPKIDDVGPPPGRGNGREVRDDVTMSEPRRKRSAARLIVFLLLLAVAGAAVYGAWTERAKISAIVAALQPPPPAPVRTPTAALALPADSSKSNDRLLPGAPGQPSQQVTAPAPAPPAPVAPTVRIVGDSPSTPAAGPASPGAGSLQPPSATGVKPPTPGAPGASGPGQQVSVGPVPTTTTPSQPTLAAPSVIQKATLYEEPTDPGVAANKTLAIPGTVSWSFVTGGTDGPAIVGAVSIPDRKLTVKITIHRNMDTSLPASHMVEVLVTTPNDFPGKSVQNVPTIVLKPSEDAKGDQLIGASATVASGFYWIALSSGAKDLSSNIALLRDRGWIDIRLIYQSGQRAILTLEKGASGDQAFAKAVSAWQAG